MRFYYRAGEQWEQLGPAHTMRFALDHFTGCRFGLFLYSTRETGGKAAFSRFRYIPELPAREEEMKPG